ncbi:MAG: purine-cytosine permease [Phycisphaerae bacterium]
MASQNLPAYLASAQPNPTTNRAPWYKNTAQTFAGIFLWIAFYDQLAGTSAGPGALGMGGLGIAILGLVAAGLICHYLFYLVPGMLGMKTGLPLYIVGTSTFGTKGGFFIPGIFMGLLQIGWYSVATYFATKLVLGGLGMAEQYDSTLFGPPGPGGVTGFSLVFVVMAVVWGYLFAFLGGMGIGMVARLSTYFPIIPIVLLLIAGIAGAGHAGNYTPEPGGQVLPAFLLMIQMVVGFTATAGACGADFCSANRDARDVKMGGLVGIALAILFAGGLAMVAVAGAHGKDGTLVSYQFSDTLKVLLGDYGRLWMILFALGSVAPACFCSFIIGNSLSTMLAKPKARVPITMAGATIGIILAALGVAGNLAPFFGLIGASFGPVIGAMIADYLLSGKKWAGPREGISIPGYAAWLIGFAVGVSNNGFLFGDNPPVPGWFPTGVASLVVGFIVYAILAKAGLEGRTVPIPTAKPEPEAVQQPV